MGEVDSLLTSALLETLSNCKPKRTLIYTGGGWLYGSTPPEGADESTSFKPTPEFSWMVENSRRVVSCTGLNGLTVHPANVVDKRKLGVPPILIEENARAAVVRIPASVETTWPLVERDELAQLFYLALDKGKAGQDYIGASIEAIDLGKLAAIVSNHFGIYSEPIHEPIEYWMERYGNWARGYSLNQVLSAEKAKAELGWMPEFTL
jgi:nucleoside-diphosphate-sugar epimerase